MYVEGPQYWGTSALYVKTQQNVVLYYNEHDCRLDYQPLLGKGARAPPPNSLLGKERRPDSRKRRKSSLT